MHLAMGGPPVLTAVDCCRLLLTAAVFLFPDRPLLRLILLQLAAADVVVLNKVCVDGRPLSLTCNFAHQLKSAA
jgi:G3E family GTPase